MCVCVCVCLCAFEPLALFLVLNFDWLTDLSFFLSFFLSYFFFLCFGCRGCVVFQTSTLTERHLQLAFSDWDTRGTGHITPKQLRHLMHKGGLPPGITDADVDELIEFADSNQDGKLSLQEMTELLMG